MRLEGPIYKKKTFLGIVMPYLINTRTVKSTFDVHIVILVEPREGSN